MLLEKVIMQRKKTTNSAVNALIIFMMITFVISAVFPDYSLEKQTVNIDETDMDGQESNEEKKENKEQKENLQQDFPKTIMRSFEQKNSKKNLNHFISLQEHYLPVITPPPDYMTDMC